MADKPEKDLELASDCKWVRALDAGGNSIRIAKDEFKNIIGTAITTGSIDISGLKIRASANDSFVEIAINGTATEQISKDVEIPGVNLATRTGVFRKSIFRGITTRDYNVIYIAVSAGTEFGVRDEWDVNMYSRF